MGNGDWRLEVAQRLLLKEADRMYQRVVFEMPECRPRRRMGFQKPGGMGASKLGTIGHRICLSFDHTHV